MLINYNLINLFPIIVSFLCWIIALGYQRDHLFKNNIYNIFNPRLNIIKFKGKGLRADNAMKHIEQQSSFFIIPLICYIFFENVYKLPNKNNVILVTSIIYCLARIGHTFAYIYNFGRARELTFVIQLICIIIIIISLFKIVSENKETFTNKNLSEDEYINN
jgi:uncharacterized MAPEG superfamily protein